MNIGLLPSQAKDIADHLNVLLSDEFLLYTKTRNAHWNVESTSFMELHKLFEDQYEQINDFKDDCAERVRSLDQPALGSMKQFLANTTLVEMNTPLIDSFVALKELLEDHESIIRYIRDECYVVANNYNALGIVNFLTGLSEKHEKIAWILRSYYSK